MKIELSHQRRHQFVKALKNQPDSYYMGTNWAGMTCKMSEADYRHRDRILKVLENPPKAPKGCLPVIYLPMTSWNYIYAVMQQTQIRYRDTQGPWLFMTEYDQFNQTHRRLQKFFAEKIGIKRPPKNTGWTG